MTTILRNNFVAKKLVIVKPYRFYKRTKREGESFLTFAPNLKHLASKCQFGTHLNKAFRSRFVSCLGTKEMQNTLLPEEQAFDRVLKIAFCNEAGEKMIAAFSQNGLSPVHKMDSGNHRSSNRNKPPNKAQAKSALSCNNNDRSSECLSCGKSDHLRSQYKFRNHTGHVRGRYGHIVDACKSKPQMAHHLK